MRGSVEALRHGSLFSGIGGFDLAAEWMGWTNIFHCEFNPFCQRVLKHYFQKTISYEDIRKTDFTIHKGSIDILTGGFPCQPYSLAGKRLGKEDERHLWPSMLRAIREIRPRWVVAENVLGLVSWDDGVVFEEVQSDLEAEGYQVQSFVLPAAGVDAPHRRERIWFIAYSGSIGRNKKRRNSNGEIKNETLRDDLFIRLERPGEIRAASDTNHREQSQQQERDPKNRRCTSKPWNFSGPGTGDGNIDRNITEGIRQLGTDTCFLQEAAPYPGSVGCHNGSNNRQERPVQNDQRVAKEDQSERERRQRWTGEAGSTPPDTYGSRFQEKGPQQQATGFKQHGELDGITTHSDGPGIQGRQAPGYAKEIKPPTLEHLGRYGQPSDWESFPTQSPVCNGDDGLSAALDSITFSKWRAESIKAGGNAIVPQVALQIFKAINEMILTLRDRP